MKLLHQGNHQLRLFQPRVLEYPLHLHNALEIVYLTSGTATVIYDKKDFLMQPGDWFVSFPNQVHSYVGSTAVTGYVIIIPVNPFLTPYYSTLEQNLPENPFLRKGEWESTQLDTLIELCFREPTSPSDPVLIGYLHVIVGKLLSQLTLRSIPAGSPDALRALLLYLNHNYKQPLTRSQIAKAVGYNESHISHLFTDTFHMTLTEYLTSMRITDAVDLLARTDQSISQIALSLGFGSIRNFNRAFAKHVRQSPSAYRLSAKKQP